MIVVAARNMLGPEPVEALVVREWRDGGAGKPHPDQHEDRDGDRRFIPPLGHGGAAERNQSISLQSENGAVPTPIDAPGYSRTSQAEPIRGVPREPRPAPKRMKTQKIRDFIPWDNKLGTEVGKGHLKPLL